MMVKLWDKYCREHGKDCDTQNEDALVELLRSDGGWGGSYPEAADDLFLQESSDDDHQWDAEMENGGTCIDLDGNEIQPNVEERGSNDAGASNVQKKDDIADGLSKDMGRHPTYGWLDDTKQNEVRKYMADNNVQEDEVLWP